MSRRNFIFFLHTNRGSCVARLMISSTFQSLLPLDIIEYITFRENCQSSECIKIGGKNCITCLLTKTRPAPNVHRPPRMVCENCTKKLDGFLHRVSVAQLRRKRSRSPRSRLGSSFSSSGSSASFNAWGLML